MPKSIGEYSRSRIGSPWTLRDHARLIEEIHNLNARLLAVDKSASAAQEKPATARERLLGYLETPETRHGL